MNNLHVKTGDNVMIISGKDVYKRQGDIDPITVPELAALAQRKLAALCNAPDTGTAVQVKLWERAFRNVRSV